MDRNSDHMQEDHDFVLQSVVMRDGRGKDRERGTDERETKTRDKIVKLSFYKYQNINLSYYNLFLL